MTPRRFARKPRRRSTLPRGRFDPLRDEEIPLPATQRRALAAKCRIATLWPSKDGVIRANRLDRASDLWANLTMDPHEAIKATRDCELPKWSKEKLEGAHADCHVELTRLETAGYGESLPRRSELKDAMSAIRSELASRVAEAGAVNRHDEAMSKADLSVKWARIAGWCGIIGVAALVWPTLHRMLESVLKTERRVQSSSPASTNRSPTNQPASSSSKMSPTNPAARTSAAPAPPR